MPFRSEDGGRVDRTAGIVVIGNEILSGKVVDTNSAFLTRELRALGVDVLRITTIPDDLADIAATVREFHERFDFVFTSGGIGPTHDDVTIEGIARAFDRKVVREGGLVEKLRQFYGGELNDARLKMAEMPEGSELLHAGALAFPTICVGKNVYILPGIPEILVTKFNALRERFVATPFHLRVVYSRRGEGSIAECLNETLRRYPALMLGSYPKLGDPEYSVKLTLESKDVEYLERALRQLLDLLPEDSVVRIEGGSKG